MSIDEITDIDDEENKTKKFKVSFEIEGEILADDTELNEENIELFLENELSIEGSDYYGNRDIDCVITNLEIKEVKE